MDQFAGCGSRRTCGDPHFPPLKWGALDVATLAGARYVLCAMKRWRDIRDKGKSPERLAEVDAAVRADLAKIEERYPGAVEALPYARAAIARELLGARMEAGLTPERLAARVGKSASFIRESEAGRADVTARYFFALWRACRLPPHWVSPASQQA